MSNQNTCPKCGSQAYYETESGFDIFLCGSNSSATDAGFFQSEKCAIIALTKERDAAFLERDAIQSRWEKEAVRSDELEKKCIRAELDARIVEELSSATMRFWDCNVEREQLAKERDELKAEVKDLKEETDELREAIKDRSAKADEYIQHMLDMSNQRDELKAEVARMNLLGGQIGPCEKHLPGFEDGLLPDNTEDQ